MSSLTKPIVTPGQLVIHALNTPTSLFSINADLLTDNLVTMNFPEHDLNIGQETASYTHIETWGSLKIKCKTVDIIHGGIAARQDITIETHQFKIGRSLPSSQPHTVIGINSIPLTFSTIQYLSNGSFIASGQNISLAANSVLVHLGEIRAHNNLELIAPQLTNTGGIITGGKQVTLTVKHLINTLLSSSSQHSLSGQLVETTLPTTPSALIHAGQDLFFKGLTIGSNTASHISAGANIFGAGNIQQVPFQKIIKVSGGSHTPVVPYHPARHPSLTLPHVIQPHKGRLWVFKRGSIVYPINESILATLSSGKSIALENKGNLELRGIIQSPHIMADFNLLETGQTLTPIQKQNTDFHQVQCLIDYARPNHRYQEDQQDPHGIVCPPRVLRDPTATYLAPLLITPQGIRSNISDLKRLYHPSIEQELMLEALLRNFHRGYLTESLLESQEIYAYLLTNAHKFYDQNNTHSQAIVFHGDRPSEVPFIDHPMLFYYLATFQNRQVLLPALIWPQSWAVENAPIRQLAGGIYCNEGEFHGQKILLKGDIHCKEEGYYQIKDLTIQCPIYHTTDNKPIEDAITYPGQIFPGKYHKLQGGKIKGGIHEIHFEYLHNDLGTVETGPLWLEGNYLLNTGCIDIQGPCFLDVTQIVNDRQQRVFTQLFKQKSKTKKWWGFKRSTKHTKKQIEAQESYPPVLSGHLSADELQSEFKEQISAPFPDRPRQKPPQLKHFQNRGGTVITGSGGTSLTAQNSITSTPKIDQFGKRYHTHGGGSFKRKSKKGAIAVQTLTRPGFVSEGRTNLKSHHVNLTATDVISKDDITMTGTIIDWPALIITQKHPPKIRKNKSGYTETRQTKQQASTTRVTSTAGNITAHAKDKFSAQAPTISGHQDHFVAGTITVSSIILQTKTTSKSSHMNGFTHVKQHTKESSENYVPPILNSQDKTRDVIDAQGKPKTEIIEGKTTFTATKGSTILQSPHIFNNLSVHASGGDAKISSVPLTQKCMTTTKTTGISGPICLIPSLAQEKPKQIVSNYIEENSIYQGGRELLKSKDGQDVLAAATKTSYHVRNLIKTFEQGNGIGQPLGSHLAQVTVGKSKSKSKTTSTTTGRPIAVSPNCDIEVTCDSEHMSQVEGLEGLVRNLTIKGGQVCLTTPKETVRHHEQQSSANVSFNVVTRSISVGGGKSKSQTTATLYRPNPLTVSQLTTLIADQDVHIATPLTTKNLHIDSGKQLTIESMQNQSHNHSSMTGGTLGTNGVSVQYGQSKQDHREMNKPTFVKTTHTSLINTPQTNLIGSVIDVGFQQNSKPSKNLLGQYELPLYEIPVLQNQDSALHCLGINRLQAIEHLIDRGRTELTVRQLVFPEIEAYYSDLHGPLNGAMKKHYFSPENYQTYIRQHYQNEKQPFTHLPPAQNLSRTGALEALAYINAFNLIIKQLSLEGTYNTIHEFIVNPACKSRVLLYHESPLPHYSLLSTHPGEFRSTKIYFKDLVNYTHGRSIQVGINLNFDDAADPGNIEFGHEQLNKKTKSLATVGPRFHLETETDITKLNRNPEHTIKKLKDEKRKVKFFLPLPSRVVDEEYIPDESEEDDYFSPYEEQPDYFEEGEEQISPTHREEYLKDKEKIEKEENKKPSPKTDKSQAQAGEYRPEFQRPNPSQEMNFQFFDIAQRQHHHQEINQRLKELNPGLDIHLFDSKAECLDNWQQQVFGNHPPSPVTARRITQQLNSLYDQARSSQLGVNSTAVRYGFEASQGKEYYVNRRIQEFAEGKNLPKEEANKRYRALAEKHYEFYQHQNLHQAIGGSIAMVAGFRQPVAAPTITQRGGRDKNSLIRPSSIPKRSQNNSLNSLPQQHLTRQHQSKVDELSNVESKGGGSKNIVTSEKVKNSLRSKEQPWVIRPGQEYKAKIFGRAQKTGTPGHEVRAYREAIEKAKEENVDKVLLNRGYNRIIDPKIKPNCRPDVMVVKKNGKVDAIEVPSRTDDFEILIERNEVALGKFPKELRGAIDLAQITKDPK
ncbi:MAG TPA: hemagglutinin repeat-containing protein [Candidatus Nitrosotenuis sp.]|nr:hemagglutinin repeat-containing protein [Candidatus Nitrosotenuis sp.]